MPYQQPQTVQQPQNFSQPTIHADIVQINGDRTEAENYPVPTGGTQMMINKAEDKIFIKTVYANNQSNVDEFVKQPKTAQKAVNYDDFVTREELEQRLAQITPKKEVEKNEEYNAKARR
jgi:hypothetical protein